MLLRRKTVVLVTHGMHFLKQCDRVIFLKDGSIEEEGTHKELMDQKVGSGGCYTYNQDGLYASMAMFDVRRNGAEVKKHTRSRMGEMVLELYHILLQNPLH